MRQYHYFILRCLQLGLTARQIAAALGYSRSTVAVYLWRLRQSAGLARTEQIVPHLLGET